MAYGYYQQPNYQQPTYPTYQSQNGLNWVQGESGAKSWMIGRGETVLLMDSENPVFYIKSSDAAGMPAPLRVFDYTERTQTNATSSNTAFDNASADFITREEYDGILADLKDLRSMIDKMQKPTTGRKREVQADE